MLKSFSSHSAVHIQHETITQKIILWGIYSHISLYSIVQFLLYNLKPTLYPDWDLCINFILKLIVCCLTLSRLYFMHIQDLNKVNNILKLDINEVWLRQLVLQLWTVTGLWFKMYFEAVFNVQGAWHSPNMLSTIVNDLAFRVISWQHRKATLSLQPGTL